MSRAVDLVGRRPSGVDRVCLAYLDALIDAPEPVFGLVRTVLGYVLLDQDGMVGVRDRLQRRVAWGDVDILARLTRKSGSSRRRVDADLRRLAHARCSRRGLARMLRQNLPVGTAYINVDQTNLRKEIVEAVRAVSGAKIAVFLHDTIPLDYPQFQTPASARRLREILDLTQVSADVILTNSIVSQQDIARHIGERCPPITVAPLGIEADFFQIGNNAATDLVPKPYFLCLGTIEPRKNHVFLIDLWEDMAQRADGQEIPHLVICGRRGWMSEQTFARLDQSPLRGSFLHEFNDLPDSDICHLVAGAQAMLFPSLAEGYGLPPLEAAAVGCPVICNDLPVIRETLAEYPIYASVTDSYLWEEAISRRLNESLHREDQSDLAEPKFSPPTWSAHFNTVLRVT